MFRILSIALLVASSRLTENQPSFSLLASKRCSNTRCGHVCHTCPWEHCSLECPLVPRWLLCQSKLFWSDAAGLTVLGNKRCQHSFLLSCSVLNGTCSHCWFLNTADLSRPKNTISSRTLIFSSKLDFFSSMNAAASPQMNSSGGLLPFANQDRIYGCHTFCLRAYKCLF